MSKPEFGGLGYGIAVAISASSLMIVTINLGRRLLAERSNPDIANYLIVGLLSIACWSAFWVIESVPTDLRLLTLLVGMHGVVWSLWYVRLAFRLKALPRKAALLCILAATTSFLGIAIATEPELTQLSAVSIAAYYAMYIGIQIFLTTIYFYREFEKEQGLQLVPSREHRKVATHADPRRHHIHGNVIHQEVEEESVRTTAG
jgi:hypothetical protein